MAVDEAIATAFAQGAAPPTIRFYRWASPAFSIGAFQTLPSFWTAFLSSHAIPLVRRITGGRGVLHNQNDQEMTYAVIADTRTPPFSGGIRPTFYAISEGLLAGLKTLGIDAALHTSIAPSPASHPQKSHPLCFSTPSRYEMIAQGKKLCGSAQKRWSGRFLQQGSLALSRNPHHPEDQITLRELVTPLPDWETLEAALTQGISTTLAIRLEPGRLTPEEQNMAARLATEKYATDAWNRHRRLDATRLTMTG